MRVLVISDIHGNLPALEFVLKQEKIIDLVISLGDVVNYGPWSNECVELLDTLQNRITVLGNHEEAFIKGKYQGSNLVTKAFFEFCFSSFYQNEKIISYKKSYTYLDCDFKHTLNNTYIFHDTNVQINKDTFIGHSHRLFAINVNGYKLVNAGSVGQNRTNIDELNYVIWNSESKVVELVKKDFSADKIINEMKIKKYPEICMNYILSKRIKH